MAEPGIEPGSSAFAADAITSSPSGLRGTGRISRVYAILAYKRLGVVDRCLRYKYILEPPIRLLTDSGIARDTVLPSIQLENKSNYFNKYFDLCCFFK